MVDSSLWVFDQGAVPCSRNGRPMNTHDRSCFSDYDAGIGAGHADHKDSACGECGCCWGCDDDCCAEWFCPNGACGCSEVARSRVDPSEPISLR